MRLPTWAAINRVACSGVRSNVGSAIDCRRRVEEKPSAMNSTPQDLAKAASDIEEAAHAGSVPQLTMMVRRFALAGRATRSSCLGAGDIPRGRRARPMAQIELNSWNKPFYDAISRRDLRDFIVQLGIFAVIAGGLLVLNVAQTWLAKPCQAEAARGLVADLVGLWLQPRRAFWLANAAAPWAPIRTSACTRTREAVRAVGRPRRGSAAGGDAVRQLRERAVGALQRTSPSSYRRPGLCPAGLHAVGRDPLCRSSARC